MKHIVCFSGGKDSTALILWAKENLPEFTTVFCDTGWEHPITYAYVEEINQTVLGGKLVKLKNDDLPGGMRQLVQIKGMIPQNSGRFCTVDLKVVPTQRYVMAIEDDYCLYDGKRCDESEERSNLPEREWADIYDCYVYHPLRHHSARMCFELSGRHGVKPNPLYMLGASRVGCFPCINLNLGDLKRMSPLIPELRSRIKELEGHAKGRSFFGPSFIPERFQTGFDEKSGKKFPTSDDVFRYIDSVDENQLPLLPARSCMSVYNLCE